MGESTRQWRDDTLYYHLLRLQQFSGRPIEMEPHHYGECDISDNLERLAKQGLITFSMQMAHGQVLARVTAHACRLKTIEQLYPEKFADPDRPTRNEWAALAEVLAEAKKQMRRERSWWRRGRGWLRRLAEYLGGC